jgi:DNA-binding Lrp family transcriptional regulator
MKEKAHLDSMDRRLLQKAQDEFPLTLRPWATIGNDLGITEKEVLDRLSKLSRRGVIRKVGPALDARRVGLSASTLIAMKVPSEKLLRVARIVSKYREVSHCYQREHEYNLWFTMAARDEPRLEEMLEEIKRESGIAEDHVLNLPSTRTFKIDVRFQLT